MASLSCNASTPRNLVVLLSLCKGVTDRGLYAISEDWTFKSYDEIYASAVTLSMQFQAMGLRLGDRVVLSLKSDFKHVEFLFALILCRAIPVSVKPLDFRASNYQDYIGKIVDQQQAAYICSDLAEGANEQECGLLTLHPVIKRSTHHTDFESGSRINNVESGGYKRNDSALCLVQYSSGSTSTPKAVALSHSSIIQNLIAITQLDRRAIHTIGMNVLPLCHDMGLIGGLLSNLLHRNSLLLCPTASFLRNTLPILRRCREMGASITALPNSFLEYLSRILSIKKAEADLLATWETIYVGAEPIRQTIVESFLQKGCAAGLATQSLVFCYGLAEATLIVTAHRYQSDRQAFHTFKGVGTLARVGAPVSGMALKIIDSDLHGVGEIAICGNSMFNGYDGQQDYRTQWFGTGDLGLLHEGALHVAGRIRDIVIIGGQNYYCIDFEEFVARRFGVDSCLAFQQDTTFGLIFCAKQPLSPDAVAEAISGEFGVVPHFIRQIAPRDIVRTTSGKAIKSATFSSFLS